MARESGAVDVLSGAGVGMFIGILVGLASSPVVSTVASALAAGVLALLSIPVSGGGTSPISDGRSRSLRVLGFGVAGTAALLIGVHLRAQDAFGTRPKDLVAQWIEAEYPDSVARALVAYGRMGVIPAGMQVSAHVVPTRPEVTSTFLMNAAGERCAAIRPDLYASAADALDAMRQAGGRWAALAGEIERVSPDRHADLLRAAWSLRCEGDEQ